MSEKQYEVMTGTPHPLGATVNDEGVNFSLYSENATGVELLLFEKHHHSQPFQVIKLDPAEHRTFHFWHVFIKGLPSGTLYNFRVDGPKNVHLGHRFNPAKALLDPYGKGKTETNFNREAATGEADNVEVAMRSMVIDTRHYDWEGDKSLGIHKKDSIIYELHVGGFTRNQNAGVERPGTFRALIEKIPYLQELGITAIELLPVFAYDDKTQLNTGPNGEILTDYWGYSTISFFAPHVSFCADWETGSPMDEFRDMVKAMHKAGIEVILDVVFNHTDEGNHEGPWFNFKGIDNSVYYYLNPDNHEFYYDYSGCGNTLKANHPVVSKFIHDCLKYWVEEMHVDGFRFDEGSILSRGENGAPLKYPPVLWDIELNEAFDKTKLIAEAWDASGLYQIGSFPGYRWSEWNGKYRDTIRRFGKGDPGVLESVAYRIAGSSDLYQSTRHKPTNSINFVTCHDGFTMWDLVSYNQKDNWLNGEGNSDGIDGNLSWNSGVDGPTDDEATIRFRKQRIKNFVTMQMLSVGVPMILSGDEVGKSQHGNNNVYCQNNETAWFDWSLIEINKDLFRFFKMIIQFRKESSFLRRDEFFKGVRNSRGVLDLEWHGSELYSPGWNDPHGRALAFTMGAFEKGERDIHVMMNMHYEPLEFAIPQYEKVKWQHFIDTYQNSPDDILDPRRRKLIKSDRCLVNAYSIIVLISK